MVKKSLFKNKLIASVLTGAMVLGSISTVGLNAYADGEDEEIEDNGGYYADIQVPADLEDGTYYGIQEVSNKMPGVGDDNHPFSYMIEVAVTVESGVIKNVELTHIDQATARDLDVDYMNWSVSEAEGKNLAAFEGLDAKGDRLYTGTDTVTGATKSNLGILRAVVDALEAKTTESTYGTTALPNEVTATDAVYPAAGAYAEVKLDFGAIENPENFAIYNADASAEEAAANAYGGIRWIQGKVVNSKNKSTAIMCDADYDYDAATQTLKIYNTDTTGIGSYSINMYDKTGKYQDAYVTFELNDPSVDAGDITLENNKLSVKDGEDVSVKDLSALITSIEVDGKEYVTYTSNHGIYQSGSPAAAMFKADGTVILDGKVNQVVAITEADYNTTRGKNATSPLAAKGEYNVTIHIAGYPDVTGKVVNNGVAEVSIKAEATELTQDYVGAKDFTPTVSATNGNYTFTSSNTSVATVGADNKVTIKGAGSTVLKVTSTDSTYSVATTEATLVVNAPAGSVSYNDAIVVDAKKCGVDLATYLANATVKVTGPDGKAASYTASNVFDTETGKVNLDASVKSGRNTVTVFAAYGEYDLEVTYAGFETITAEVEKAGTVYRVYGSNRYQTSMETADALKEVLGVDKFENVIVTTGDNFADALAGSYLASEKNAPILLINEKMSAAVCDYIEANLADNGTVYVLGGTGAVKDEWVKGLENIKRLSGKSRYETNIKILEEVGVEAGSDVLVVTGTNFADSLSVSATGLPILLVGDALTTAQTTFLDSIEGEHIHIIGGEAAVNENIEKELNAERIKGKDRYETSVKVAEEFFDAPTDAVLAFGGTYPDGLCGGVLAKASNAPLILTHNDKASYAADYIQAEGIVNGFVLGGPVVCVSDKAVETIFSGSYDFVVKK